MSGDEKAVWKKWEVWDKLRFEHDSHIYESKLHGKNAPNEIPAKPKQKDPDTPSRSNGTNVKSPDSSFHIPKKKRLSG